MLSKLRALFVKKQAPQGEYPRYGVLMDAGTRAVLAVSDNDAALSFLHEALTDTYHMVNVAWPHYRAGLPFALHQPSFAHLSWNWGARKFEPTRADIATAELRNKSRLAMHKLNAVIHIMRVISNARGSLTPGLLLQETVYLTKKMQAHGFRERGYDERAIFEYPYVLQYADLRGISYRDAADDIILKAKLDDDLLATTELLRLAYFDKLKRIKRADDIVPLLEAFTREAYTNSHV